MNRQLYIPNRKIIVASSFEGVVNNGAKECLFVSLNTYDKMLHDKSLHGRSILLGSLTPQEFRSSKAVRDSKILETFLKLRPLVAVAEDYLNVLQIAVEYPDLGARIARGDAAAIQFAEGEFEALKASTTKQREVFKKEFYVERKKQQDASYKEWLALQEPYADTLEQLRILSSLKKEAGTRDFSGFTLYYVTSKDEATTYQLCTVYGEFNLFKDGEVKPSIGFDKEKSWPAYFQSLQTCLITQERIIGKDKVEKADKVKQMALAAAQENIPNGQVFRVNDRYDAEEFSALKAAGFVHNFVVTGGYAFQQDYDKAQKAGIRVVEKNRLAETLSEYASKLGF